MKALLLLVAGVVGLVETVLPRAAVRAWTLAVYRNAGDAEPRGWVHTAVRVEGALLVLVSLVGLFRTVTAGESEDSESGDAESGDAESGDAEPGSA